MAPDPPERPNMKALPDMWPSTSANSFRRQYLAPAGSETHSPHQDSAAISRVSPAIESPAHANTNGPPVVNEEMEGPSRLASGAAFNIIRFLRKLADNGQALLVTIHQPSSVLFEYFDELLLHESGGRLVYHGSLGKDSRSLINYFEGNGAKKCPPSANPAEYMLEAIGAGDPNYKGKDWGDVWASSHEREERGKEIQQMISDRRKASTNANTDDDREYAMPLSTQISTVVKRSVVSYWRTPDYMIGKFMLHIVTGRFNTFTFYHVGNSQIDMQSRLFSMFMTLTIAPPLIQQLQPKFCCLFLQFRAIYQSREANSKIYS